MLESVHELSDIFLDPFERPPDVQFVQARPNVVAFWVEAHELVQPLRAVAHQLRLAQILGHRRYPLVRSPELGIFPFHLHLPFWYGPFYFAGLSGRDSTDSGSIRGTVRTQLKMWVLW